MREITKPGEIVIGNNNWGRALGVARTLVEEGYAVMLTTEEDLIVVNYLEAYNDSMASDRNQVVFMKREEFEEGEFSILPFAENEEKQEE